MSSTLDWSSPFGAADGPPVPVTHGPLVEFPNDPIACMRRQLAAHGKISALREANQQVVFVVGPDFNKQVLSNTQVYHSRFFSLRGPKNSAQRRLTGGLLSMNEEQHRRHRRMLMGPFQKRSIEGYQGQILALCDEMLASWKVGQVRPVHDDMAQFMLRVTSTMVFGFDVADLAYEIGHMLDHWVQLNHDLGMGALVRNERFDHGYGDLLKYAEQLELRIRTMIDLRRADESKTGGDVLSILVRTHDEEGGLTDEELIGHAALIFGAAHMTTAHTLTWTLFLLSQHPQMMAELADEMQRELGGQPPRLDQVQGGLPVLERVIKESMRVLPASAYSQRINNVPTQLGPFDLPRGTPVVFSQFMTHHLPELFPEPERFLPDRWLTIQPSPYSYLPFATGPRMCLGGPLAMLILKTALPTILQRFRVSVEPGADVNGQVIATMLTPTTPVPLRLCEPDDQFDKNPVVGNIHTLVDLGEY